ncbi:GyrI-like domain-containing protein [Clostridiaceae bacterium M8S5]|nr:GyrI-like domain-containing protein [Clostridiaceae bacterium M8S5]
MEYIIKRLTNDAKYVGLKYNGKIETFKTTDLPKLWGEFTEKLYKSSVENLIDKKEAIGYISYNMNSKNKSYEYIASCEVSEFANCDNFTRVIIPAGRYIYFKLQFKNKAENLDELLTKVLPNLSSKFNFNRSFGFEFYPEDFNYLQEDTCLYFAVQLLED